jgi:hypothetical protein
MLVRVSEIPRNPKKKPVEGILQSQESKSLRCALLGTRNTWRFGKRAEPIIKVLCCEDERSQPPIIRQYVQLTCIDSVDSQVGENKIDWDNVFAQEIRHEGRDESREKKDD